MALTGTAKIDKGFRALQVRAPGFVAKLRWTRIPWRGRLMSMFEKLKDLIKGHPDQARQGVEKAGDAFDAKTGNKYQSQVDTAQQKLNEQIGKEPPASGQGRPPQP
ncbi:hypothetical protein GCM10010425_73850 [Streptomyces spororaveus]|uniref:Antitoxin protein of toxin-antitoxin system n=2 Tax=Streptomyces spororaveus TaxID=284039 RepID=A0ABQ3TJ05_9ACTN|nr:hypothetical protein Sspor_59080 [Streptomyces spororaveus]